MSDLLKMFNRITNRNYDLKRLQHILNFRENNKQIILIRLYKYIILFESLSMLKSLEEIMNDDFNNEDIIEFIIAATERDITFIQHIVGRYNINLSGEYRERVIQSSLDNDNIEVFNYLV